MPLTWKSLGSRHTWAGPAPGGTTTVRIHLQGGERGELSFAPWDWFVQKHAIVRVNSYSVYLKSNRFPLPNTSLLGNGGFISPLDISCVKASVFTWAALNYECVGRREFLITKTNQSRLENTVDIHYALLAKVGAARGSDISFANLTCITRRTKVVVSCEILVY